MKEDRPAVEERVPLFGTWPRIYAAVIVNALILMALITIFSRWRY